jgi:hypothetical protein
MLGYAPEELVGAAFGKSTHPDDVAEDCKFVAAAIAGKRDGQAISDGSDEHLCGDRQDERSSVAGRSWRGSPVRPRQCRISESILSRDA